MNISFLSQLLWVKNSGVTWPGGPGLRSLVKLGLQSHLNAWLGLGDPLPRWLRHTAGKLVLAAGRYLVRRASPEGFLNVLTIWQPASPGVSNPWEQGRSCNIFHDLGSEVTTITSAIFCLSRKLALIRCGRILHGTWAPGGKGIGGWGASWRQATSAHL